MSKIWIRTSLIIVLLVSIASLLGIFNPTTYSQETANWAIQAVGQDIGNLLAVAVFLVSTYLLRSGYARAFLVWLGTLLYFIYAYLIYSFFIHFNYLFLIYVGILGISTYTLIGGLLEQDLPSLLKPLINKKMRVASIVLILTGGLFATLWLSEIIPALLSGQPPRSAITADLWVNPIQVIDLAFVLPGMILTGLLLWKRKLFGYLFAAPWLTFSALMGSSIVATMIMELNNGNYEAIVPLAMVSVIVISSAVVLYYYLKEFKEK